MSTGDSFNAIVSDKNERLLCDLCEMYAIHVPHEAAHLMLHHLALVLQKNQVMNLTRITSVVDGLVLHLLDSCLLYPAVAKTSGVLLDIGTGAGFPGIPLAALDKRPMVLMDSVRKKARAVQEFIIELGLDPRVTTTSERAEAYACNHREQFGVVVARAVAPLAVLIEYAQPLLALQGRIVVSKGRITEDEFSAGMNVAHRIGYSYVSRETYELPEEKGHREIIVFEKTKPSPVLLPRAIGEAKKHPLV